MPDRPPPDPSKLLEHWMEKGEMPPGRLIANLKTVEMLAMMLLPRQWLVPAGPPAGPHGSLRSPAVRQLEWG